MIKKVNNDRVRGIACIIASAFFFALMNLFIRLSGDVPTIQKCFFRNAVAGVIAAAMLLKNKESFRPKKGSMFRLFMRALCGTVGLICNFYAIDRLNISDASALNKLSPFFAILFSGAILGEHADKFEWIMTLTAFLGAMLVVKPGFSPEVFPAAVGLLGGMGAGAAYTFVRSLGKSGENRLIIILFFSVFSCAVTLPLMIINYCPMNGEQLLFLILTGAAAMGGQFFITSAYVYAPAREISVFDYSQVLFAAMLGFVFLGQIPDGVNVMGYFVIIAAAAVKWRYGMKKERKG